MAIAALWEFAPQPDRSEEQAGAVYDEASREFNGGQLMTKAADWGPGHLAHFAGQSEDGSWWVVDVWESRDAMDQFISRMMPIMQSRIEETGIQPAVRIVAIHNLVTE
jgi:hypothetical protein